MLHKNRWVLLLVSIFLVLHAFDLYVPEFIDGIFNKDLADFSRNIAVPIALGAAAAIVGLHAWEAWYPKPDMQKPSN